MRVVGEPGDVAAGRGQDEEKVVRLLELVRLLERGAQFLEPLALRMVPQRVPPTFVLLGEHARRMRSQRGLGRPKESVN